MTVPLEELGGPDATADHQHTHTTTMATADDGIVKTAPCA
jgi:hypothetical protein